jgi:hypothetical protein
MLREIRLQVLSALRYIPQAIRIFTRPPAVTCTPSKYADSDSKMNLSVDATTQMNSRQNDYGLAFQVPMQIRIGGRSMKCVDTRRSGAQNAAAGVNRPAERASPSPRYIRVTALIGRRDHSSWSRA